MPIVNNPSTFVLTPDEDKTPLENINAMTKLLLNLVPTTNNFTLQLTITDQNSVDMQEMCDIMSNANETIKGCQEDGDKTVEELLDEDDEI